MFFLILFVVLVLGLLAFCLTGARPSANGT